MVVRVSYDFISDYEVIAGLECSPLIYQEPDDSKKKNVSDYGLRPCPPVPDPINKHFEKATVKIGKEPVEVFVNRGRRFKGPSATLTKSKVKGVYLRKDNSRNWIELEDDRGDLSDFKERG